MQRGKFVHELIEPTHSNRGFSCGHGASLHVWLNSLAGITQSEVDDDGRQRRRALHALDSDLLHRGDQRLGMILGQIATGEVDRFICRPLASSNRDCADRSNGYTDGQRVSAAHLLGDCG